MNLKERKKVVRGLGKIIRKNRIRLGLTQKDLAKEAGVNWAIVTYVETGDRETSFTRVMKLCKVLKLSLDQIMKELT